MTHAWCQVAYFAMPWLVTLCCQGVAVDQAVQVWDVLLNIGVATRSSTTSAAGAPTLNIRFLLCFCVAMLRSVRSLILPSNFAGVMVRFKTSKLARVHADYDVVFIWCISSGFLVTQSIVNSVVRSLNFQADVVMDEARRIYAQVLSDDF